MKLKKLDLVSPGEPDSSFSDSAVICASLEVELKQATVMIKQPKSHWHPESAPGQKLLQVRQKEFPVARKSGLQSLFSG